MSVGAHNSGNICRCNNNNNNDMEIQEEEEEEELVVVVVVFVGILGCVHDLNGRYSDVSPCVKAAPVIRSSLASLSALQEEVEASQKHVITRALRLVECTTHLLPSSAGSPPRRHDWLVSMHLIARELADSPGGSDHCGSGFWTALLTAWKAALMHLGVWEPWAVRSHRTVESLLMNIDPKCTGSDGSTSTTWPWEIVPSAATRTPVEGERSREEATVMSDEGAPVEREVHEAHIGAQLPEAWRSAQVPLFNGAVRRDIYNILLHPAHPYAGATPAASGQGSAFEVVIAVKADAAGQHQVYALLPRNSWMPTGFK
eukprot:gene11513-13607_t